MAKGRTKSQSEYDQEVELKELYHEAFIREEYTFDETASSLVTSLGFSPEIARQRVSEWKSENKGYMPETERANKKRKKRQESLKNKFLKRRLSSDEIKELKNRR